MKVRLSKKILFLIICLLFVFFAVAYGVGAFVFILFPKTFEPFVTTYPIFSHFAKLIIGWIVCGIIAKIFK